MMTSSNGNIFRVTGGCFTNFTRAPQNILAKIPNTRNHIYGENFNLWAHIQSFSLKFSSPILFVQYTKFERIFWRARETLVKQPPGIWLAAGTTTSRSEALLRNPDWLTWILIWVFLAIWAPSVISGILWNIFGMYTIYICCLLCYYLVILTTWVGERKMWS